MHIVSLSGIDGIGKSEQISLLEQLPSVRYSGPLTRYSDKWPRLGPQEHFDWWFKTTPIEDFIALVIESLNKRHKSAAKGLLNVQDRGERMFKSVCIATLLTRDPAFGYERACAFVDSAFASSLTAREDLEIFLVPDEDYAAAASFLNRRNRHERSSPFTAEQNTIYEAYQAHLRASLQRYGYGVGEKTVLIDSCILSVQNRLRVILSEMTGQPLKLLCEGLEDLIVLSGMSESGKSSLAQALSEREGYCRLKLKYFQGLAGRDGREANSEAISNEITQFLSDHYYLKRVSLESLHGPDLAYRLKSLFGDKCRIVYIDTPEETRIRRTVAGLGISPTEVAIQVAEKDAIKCANGIEEVREIADMHFDNREDGLEKAFSAFRAMLLKP